MNIAKMLVLPKEMINLYTRKGTLLYKIYILKERQRPVAKKKPVDIF